MEQLENLSSSIYTDLLVKNLRSADLLIKLFWSLSSPSDSLLLVLGEEDQNQWHLLVPDNQNLQFSEWKDIFHFVSMNADVKDILSQILCSISNSILSSWNVLVPMLLLAILRIDEQDAAVEGISGEVFTMLQRHLINTLSCQTRAEEALAYISTCLQTLPILLKANELAFKHFV